MENQRCHPCWASHQVDHTVPSTPVANKSRCVSLERHNALTVAPGRIFTSGLIVNHVCHPGPTSHHVDHTVPSASVTNKSRCVSFERQTDVTVAPARIFI